MAVTTAIVWFRRDLRLADNPALADALARARDVVALYVHAPDEESPWAPGAASRWWLHHSLEALDGALRARGASLTIIRGPSLETLLDVARASGASSVHWNRAYEPSIARRDIEIEQQLRAAGLATQSQPQFSAPLCPGNRGSNQAAAGKARHPGAPWGSAAQNDHTLCLSAEISK